MFSSFNAIVASYPGAVSGELGEGRYLADDCVKMIMILTEVNSLPHTVWAWGCISPLCASVWEIAGYKRQHKKYLGEFLGVAHRLKLKDVEIQVGG